jgi:hypothetical protein
MTTTRQTEHAMDHARRKSSMSWRPRLARIDSMLPSRPPNVRTNLSCFSLISEMHRNSLRRAGGIIWQTLAGWLVIAAIQCKIVTDPARMKTPRA